MDEDLVHTFDLQAPVLNAKVTLTRGGGLKNVSMRGRATSVPRCMRVAAANTVTCACADLEDSSDRLILPAGYGR